MLLPSEGLIRARLGQPGIGTQVRGKEGQKVKVADVLSVLSNERNSGPIIRPKSTGSALLHTRRDSFRDELLQANQQSSQGLSAEQTSATELLEEGTRQIADCLVLSLKLTCITVADRPDAIAMAECVVVLHGGKIVHDVIQEQREPESVQAA